MFLIRFKSIAIMALVLAWAIYPQGLDCQHASAQATQVAKESQQEFEFDRQTKWKGYDQFHFKVADRSAYVVVPKEAAAGNPWVWRARFPNFHAEMDVALLGHGFHIAYVDVAELFGSPKAVSIGDAFYQHMVTKHRLSDRPALEGVSRGGLFVYNWAVKNPDKPSCIYCDTPVLDFKSWPGGKGTGLGSEPTWKQCLTAYEMSQAEALAYKGNPIDKAKTIAAANIPLLHIVSENDKIVPPEENTYSMQKELAKRSHPLKVISVKEGTEKTNGHHFTHPEPDRVVNFILKHAVDVPKRRQMLADAKRVVFLGDSITYGGGHIAAFEAWMVLEGLGGSPSESPKVINVGLPSETVSGLSEEGHAGGRFPRPDLEERLDRVLAETKPDLVFACYGINCGIYQPFDEQRFSKYQAGIVNLKQKVNAAGAKLILITPPTFDDARSDDPAIYDAVMDKYSKWLLSQEGWTVIDLHSAMANELATKRKTNPEFLLQRDGVHVNSIGSWFIASRLADWFGDTQTASAGSPKEFMKNSNVPNEFIKLTTQRMNVLKAAYLSKAGHKRPGIKAGLSIKDAELKAKEISQRMSELLSAKNADQPAENQK